ncbi:hypothetical protein [Endobacterium cereale]|uniref:hypothetical protein n=1 Tax=Endobacterium cereale TaxID=2663029 RepID=UPI002B45ADDA|nr:hypothetical protein [Endobacterium cereale]MEB2848026.1 hypothetical protein [Endobacterium cereale]
MSKKLNKIYDALVTGAADGLMGRDLYDFVNAECRKASAKRIVKASLFALSDPGIRDRCVLEAIYALAIDNRLSSLGVEEDDHEADDDDANAPTISEERKTRLESSTSRIAATGADLTLAAGDKSIH